MWPARKGTPPGRPQAGHGSAAGSAARRGSRSRTAEPGGRCAAIELPRAASPGTRAGSIRAQVRPPRDRHRWATADHAEATRPWPAPPTRDYEVVYFTEPIHITQFGLREPEVLAQHTALILNAATRPTAPLVPHARPR